MTEFPNYRDDGGDKFQFEYQKSPPIELEERSITSWLEAICFNEGKKIRHIQLIFCSDEFLFNINEKYLSHPNYTDTIAFSYVTDPIEGDIFISIDRVSDNAQRYGNGIFAAELYRVLAHGLLHLCGYTDNSKKMKREMKVLEDNYLQTSPLFS
ncbi:MAG: rRNA maturation RNase YbeY [Saprospiraceae bacterium]|nr:rRNA maturation RNase YbeY [Saprospiraceae bacterium]